MPYPNEHAARIREPGQFDRVRRENDYFGPGRDVIWGIKAGQSVMVQAIRFRAAQHTVAQAKRWLRDHGYKPIEFTEATGKMAAEVTKGEPSRDSFRFTFDILKGALEHGPENLVFGWGSVVEKDGHQVLDLEEDLLDESELEKAVYEFVLEHRTSSERHDPDTIGCGQLVESLVLTKAKAAQLGLVQKDGKFGWIVGFKVEPHVFAKVQSGDYKAFSIGGSAIREEL